MRKTLTAEEQADQNRAMQWTTKTVPSWRNVYDLIRGVRLEEQKATLVDAEAQWEKGNKEPLARFRGLTNLRALESNLQHYPATMTRERLLADLRHAIEGWALEMLT